MTVPWTHNCPHTEDSWCLECTMKLGEEMVDARNRLFAASQMLMDALDAAFICGQMHGAKQIYCPEYREASSEYEKRKCDLIRRLNPDFPT